MVFGPNFPIPHNLKPEYCSDGCKYIWKAVQNCTCGSVANGISEGEVWLWLGLSSRLCTLNNFLGVEVNEIWEWAQEEHSETKMD